MDMIQLNHPKKMVCIEPILDFGLGAFVEGIRQIEPDFVYIGFDNYNYNLPEPSLIKTKCLIKALSEFTTVHTKTLRKAWYE